MSGREGAPERQWQRNESRLLELPQRRVAVRLVGAAGFLVVALVSLVAGLAGLLAGVVTVAVWYVLGAPYGIAAGTVLLAVIVPETGAVLPLFLVGAAFLVTVLTPLLTTRGTGLAVPGVGITAAVVGAVAWLLVRAAPLWLAATGLLGAVALAAYVLYRYHLLQLGLLEDGASGTHSAARTNAADDDSTTPPPR